MLSLKKYMAFTAGIVLFLAGSLWLLTESYAQPAGRQGRIDAFTFLIPFRAEDLAEEFRLGNQSTGLENIQTTISIAIDRGGTTVYYDHWEDGLEDDLTSPVQNSTRIWGDGDPANGIAPTARSQGPGEDILLEDDVIVLQNLVTLPGGSREPSTIFYDGGDVLTAIGGAIATTLVVWPEGPGILYAGAWELYPTNRWGQEYRIPVGEDLAGQRPGFTVVGLNVQAIKDGTLVQILDKDGNEKRRELLNYGEQFAELSGIEVGDVVISTLDHPVQVDVFTANPSEDYEARAYAIVPFERWTNDYLTPRSSDGDYWLFNPDADAPLSVTVTTVNTSTTLTIPPNTTVRYSNTPTMSTATGARFSSGEEPFYGVVALSPSEARDWGYVLQPVNRLSGQVLIGWAPGNAPEGRIDVPPTDDQSRVYVTALTTTTVRVRYAGAGIPDAEYRVPQLAEVPITSPNHNMTGAFLTTENGTPFISVWGQDETAPGALPSIDAGTNIVSLRALLLQKTAKLVEDVDCSGSISLSDTVRFRLQYFNSSVREVHDVLLQDDLPSALTYVPGSTTLNNVSVPDDTAGSPFPLDGAGYGLGTVAGEATGLFAFEAKVNTPGAGTIINQGLLTAQELSVRTDAAIITVPGNGSTEPLLQLNKTLVDPAAAPVSGGQPFTYSLTITNSSPTFTYIRLPLQEKFDPNLLTFLGATPAVDLAASGVITWNDLVADSPLQPGQSINLTVRFVANQVPFVSQARNRTTVLEAVRADSPARLTCSTGASLQIVPPPPSAPSPTATSDTGPDGTETPVSPSLTPVPSPTATPGPPGSPTPTPDGTEVAQVPTPEPVLPVEVLPETGTRHTASSPGTTRFLIVVLLLGGAGAALLSRERL